MNDAPRRNVRHVALRMICDAIDLCLGALEEAIDDVRCAEAYRRLPEDLEADADLRTLALRAWPER